MIPVELYAKIHELMPIICVDIVTIVGESIILLRRCEQPAAGVLWFPGGRIEKGDTSAMAVCKILRRECGLTDIIKVDFLGCDETHFAEDNFGHGKGTHTVNLIFKAVCRGDVIIDNTSKEYEAADLTKLGLLDPYVQKWLRRA